MATDHKIPRAPRRSRPALPVAAEALWLALLLAMAAVMLSAGASKVGFQQRERRFAQVAREVAPGSSLMVMHYLGNLYPHKPPLVFWIQAASYRIMGKSTPLAARLPMIAFALAGLMFAYLFIRQLEGARTALIGTAALLLSFRFFWESKQVTLDMPMCVFLWGAFWASSRILFPHRGREPGGAAWAWTAWTFAALSVLADGPGAAVWIATLIVYATMTRRYEPLRRHLFWPGLGWLAAIVAIWLVSAATMGGHEYYKPLLNMQFRVINTFSDVRSIPRLVYKLPIGALPMGLLLPAGLWWAWRQRHRRHRGRTLFVLTWLVLGTIYFGIPRANREASLLPVYPAIALLVGRFILAGLRARRPHRVLWAHTLLASISMLLSVPALIAVLIFKPGVFPAPLPGHFAIGVLAALTIGAGAAVYFLKRGRVGVPLLALAAVVAYCGTLLFVYYMPVIHDDRVPRQIAASLNTRIAAGESIGFMNIDNSVSLYLKKQPDWLKTPNDVRVFMAHEDQRWLLTTTRAINTFANPGWPIREQWLAGSSDEPLILLSNRVLLILPEVLYESQ